MSNQTNISYKGEVTLKYKVGNKIIKKKVFNKGWSPLFKLISLILTGNMTPEELSILRPTYIDMKYENNGAWTSCLFSKVPVTPSFMSVNDPTIDGGVSYISVFSVTISYSNLDNSIVSNFDSNTNCAMFLLSGQPVASSDDSSIRMASLQVDPESVKEMAPGSQVIVEWTMKFYNA